MSAIAERPGAITDEILRRHPPVGARPARESRAGPAPTMPSGAVGPTPPDRTDRRWNGSAG
ncbi:hypothetical protein PCLA_01f0655 [Pseudomonas citronellolis]|nr:hypothetical protein PCLA_01f0655 [Pseudomonas citronellolis]